MAPRAYRPAADEVHFPETPDGWRIALHRYHSRIPDGRPAVILCGGYACNRFFIDYDETHSLARFLARECFEAWVLEMRGRGLAYPGSAAKRPRVWTFDDLAMTDVPAAIAYVRAASGRPVAWVGHSMGGMALYAYLGSGIDPRLPVAAAVTIASPVVISSAASRLYRSIGRLLLDLPYPETIHQRWVLGALWNLLGRSEAIGLGMNPANVDRALVGKALHRSLVNVPRVKLRQLAQWALHGTFASVDGGVDYRAGLRRITTPVLVVAGSDDRIATPAAVGEAVDRMGRSRCSYLEIGSALGCSTDYGHVDLIFGRNAPSEVFPRIAEWLRQEATA